MELAPLSGAHEPSGSPSAGPRRRVPTEIDSLANAYVATTARLNPIAATAMGIDGYEHDLPDYSPAGHAARVDAARDVLRALDGLRPADDVDVVTAAAMRERLGLELELDAAGENERELNVISSPLQSVRDVFDLMPAQSDDDWAAIGARLAAVPDALTGYAQGLRAAAARGQVAAARQVEAAIRQASELADTRDSVFTALVARSPASPTPGTARPAGRAGAALAKDLARGAAAARGAYGDLAQMLRAELAPRAPHSDAVGRERYELWSRVFLGATVDLDEAYAWGLAELDAVVVEQSRVAALVAGPGAGVDEAVAALDADPTRLLHGTAALRDWLQATADEAIEELAGTHFDIPEPVRRLECVIAPTHTGGIYYPQPSADFSRPGRMWWSVPPGVTEFTTWRERTTAYHEGVPGHHLQIGQTVYRADLLNDWRRLACWVSGHGEGWALYAERLMADLGFLDDPGDRLGMLDGQRLRAARVVLDIGVHLGKACPEAWGGGTWDADKAWRFLTGNAAMGDGFLRFELDRYLGWPGQAPSYAIGQRIWRDVRDAAAAEAAAAGRPFDLPAFHRRSLDVGSVGLDVLRSAVVD